MEKNKMDIKNVMQADKKLIEDRLMELMNINLTYSSKILDSMRYSLSAGGKRIRPCIFVEVLKSYNIDVEKYLDVACVIEMIHTYSLIHDDLPAMDNDTLRRGKPTNHMVYGDAIAILAGDALLNFAYELLFKFIKNNFQINSVKACEEISNCAGIYGMIGGQVSDIINENKDISSGNLEYIHENKTAKLIIASMVSAGYLANADENDMEHLRKCAYNLGMAFQISDDILDIIGNEKLLGKSVGKDVDEGKNTYPKYFGIEKSKEKLNGYVNSAIDEISEIKDKDMSFFAKLATYIGNRKY